MNAKDVIRNNLGLSDFVLQGLLADLSDEDLLVRPVASANHIAWQLGHLIVSENNLINAVCPGSMPELPQGFSESHASGDSDEGYLSKQEYLDLFSGQRRATIQALESVDESDLDRESPENLREKFPTVGSVFALQASHVLMHSGQWSVVRRKLEKPVLF